MHTVAVQACYSILVACFFLLNVCQLPGDEIPPAESLWTEWKVFFHGNWGTTFENECAFSREYRREYGVLRSLPKVQSRHTSLPVQRTRGEENCPGPRVAWGQWPSIGTSLPDTSSVSFLFVSVCWLDRVVGRTERFRRVRWWGRYVWNMVRASFCGRVYVFGLQRRFVGETRRVNHSFW